jgi:hypothetical protein
MSSDKERLTDLEEVSSETGLVGLTNSFVKGFVR